MTTAATPPFARSTVATYVDINGVVQTAGVNVLRNAHYIAGVLQPPLIEVARTNFCRQSESDPGWAAFGTTPPTVDSTNTVDNGITCTQTTFPIVAAGGYAVSRVTGSFTQNAIVAGHTYVNSSWVRLSRPLTAGEYITVYVTGMEALTGGTLLDSSVNYQTWSRIIASSYTTTLTGNDYFTIFAGRLDAPLTVWSSRRQIEEGSSASSYIVPATTTADVTRAADIDQMLAATTTGYTRQIGSFLTEGFQIGMNLTPSGFASNPASIIMAVAAQLLTVAARSVESAVAGRSLSGVSPILTSAMAINSATVPLITAQ